MLSIYQLCFKRDGYKCRHCNDRTVHPHHIVFKSHGGKDELNNLITLCPSCHLEGIHGGKLIMTVLNKTEDDVVVLFERVGKWKPH